MKKKVCFLTVCLLVIMVLPGVLFAASGTVQLVKTSSYFRVNFPSSTEPYGYMMIWDGDVKLNDQVIGEFVGKIIKTSNVGSKGYETDYHITIDLGTTIADFLSVKTNHITTGSGSDVGIIYAASPAFKVLIGASIAMSGDDMTITW